MLCQADALSGAASDAPGLQGVIAAQFLYGQLSPQPSPNLRSPTGAAASRTAGAHWGAQAAFGSITHGWTDQGMQLLSRMHRKQKTDGCMELVVA